VVQVGGEADTRDLLGAEPEPPGDRGCERCDAVAVVTQVRVPLRERVQQHQPALMPGAGTPRRTCLGCTSHVHLDHRPLLTTNGIRQCRTVSATVAGCPMAVKSRWTITLHKVMELT